MAITVFRVKALVVHGAADGCAHTDTDPQFPELIKIPARLANGLHGCGQTELRGAQHLDVGNLFKLILNAKHGKAIDMSGGKASWRFTMALAGQHGGYRLIQRVACST